MCVCGCGCMCVRLGVRVWYDGRSSLHVQTAAHEMGCFKSAVNGTAAFVQFSAAACAEDHQHDPFPDSGHNCPFKAEVEAPWVLTSMKLYAQQDGRQDSGCFQMLWSNATGSLTQDPRADSIILHPPAINVR